MDALTAVKHHADLGSPTLEQLAFASVLDAGGVDRHLRRVRGIDKVDGPSAGALRARRRVTSRLAAATRARCAVTSWGHAVVERWLVHGAGHVRAGGGPAGAHTATAATSPDTSAERARFVAAHPRGDMTGP